MKSPGISKFLNLLDYSLLTFRRKKLKNMGVFFVFVVTVFFLASFQLLSSSLQKASDDFLQHLPDITVQQMSAGRQVNLHRDVISSLSSIYGIKTIRQRVWGYYFDESNGANYTVMGVDFADFTELGDTFYRLAGGRFPSAGERGKAVIGDAVKQSMKLGSRKHFSLFKPDLSQISFETAGVFNKDIDILTGDLIIMSMGDARALFALDDNYMTDLLVDSANPDEVDNMARKISEKTVGTRVITKTQIKKTYKAVFGWRSGVGSIALLGGIVAFMILAWDKASGLSQEDKRETAILKGIGWQSRDIMLVRFLESCTLSISAFLLAYGFALLHIMWLDGFLFHPLLLGWSVLKPTFSLTPVFYLSDFLLIFSLTVAPYWCATIVPVWRSSIIRADTVI